MSSAAEVKQVLDSHSVVCSSQAFRCWQGTYGEGKVNLEEPNAAVRTLSLGGLL